MIMLKQVTTISVMALLVSVPVKASPSDPPFVPIPGSAQTIYAPIAGLEDFDEWQLAVVNRSPSPNRATIVVFSSDGLSHYASRITLNGNETRTMDVKSLLPSELTKGRSADCQLTTPGNQWA